MVQVLILVVVDNGLVPSDIRVVYAKYSVLILVVVDNGLVQRSAGEQYEANGQVLILVVVDNGLVLGVQCIE